MPRVSHDQKQYYKSRIRSIMVRHPAITQRELQERLDMEGLHLDRKYLGTLVNGLHAERVRRADRATLNYALASFQDAMLEIARAGWEIVNDPMARNMHTLAHTRLIKAGPILASRARLISVYTNTNSIDDFRLPKTRWAAKTKAPSRLRQRLSERGDGTQKRTCPKAGPNSPLF